MDGMELAVCSQCKKFGKEVVRPRQQGGKRRRVVPGDEVLPGSGDLVRKARERKGMSLEELGEELMEKSTVLRKVERGEMLPDDRLARKLEKFFGIRLRGTVDAGATDQKHSKAPKATLGDLAKVTVKK